jgi:phage tail sheath protein FI
MPGQFLHGVEIWEDDSGPRPIQTVKSSVIGLIGTAPLKTVPVNQPILITGLKQAQELFGLMDGKTTIPAAIHAIFAQGVSAIVAIRVDGDKDEDVIKNLTSEGAFEGLKAFLATASTVGVTPRILIAPKYSGDETVLANFVTVAKRMRAIIVADGPNEDDAKAKEYSSKFGGTDRVYLVDPFVKIAENTFLPASPFAAGIIAKSDNERGFWWSPSNRPIDGIIGTQRAVDFAFGEQDSGANLLNAANVTTIVNVDGYKLWGNRVTGTSTKVKFLSIRRTADMILDSLLRSHLWAVDRNITSTYLEDVSEGVNNYMRDLKALGAILGGLCWASKELNTKSAVENGEVYFDIEFTPNYPAEHVTFRTRLVNRYIEEVLK